MKNPRLIVASLTLSASALIGITQYEGYRDTAYIPVKGDVPTIGFGQTKGVKLGDTTTPQRALVALLDDANRHSNGIKKCISAPLYQHEFDAYASLAYNIGVPAFCSSSIPKKLKEGKYQEACNTILAFNGMCIKRVAGKCVKKKVLRGLVIRREAEAKTCRGSE